MVLSRAALAALKQAAALIPNQAMLINTIPLLEAKDSSEIENIVTTADKLFQFAQAHDGAADAATKEALRYRTALHAGFESLAHRPLCTATAIEICRTIKAAGKILAIRALSDMTAAHVREHLPRIYCRELVDAIFEQPYCRIANLVDKGVAQRQAASRYLHELVSAGVLREVKVGKEKLFIHPRLMQLLADDAHEVKRYEDTVLQGRRGNG